MEITAKQRRLVVIIAGLLAAGILLFIVNLVFNRSTLGPSLTKLSANETEALRINDLSQKLSPGLSISQVQANVGAIVGSDLADLEVERQKVTGDKKIPKNITASVTSTTAEQDLESAQQRGDLTTTYKSLMAKALSDCLTTARESRAVSKRENLRQLLDRVIEHLQTLQAQVDQL